MNPFTHSALSLRRRGVWEAADSGILLWRNNFVYFIPFFALPVWTAACAFRFLPDDFWYLSYLAIWWLKPLFDRLVLHVVSRRFFGLPAPSRYKELKKGLWGMSRGLLGDLLWRRFSPGRAACMPVRVLERINRKQFRQRKKSLSSGGLNFCFLVSAFGLATEAMLLGGEIVFVMSVTQMFFPSAFAYIRYNREIAEVFIFAAFCLNYILVESLYVCMGFGLYINSRVETEGWDLQLLFQKFAGTEQAGGREKTVSRKMSAAPGTPGKNGLKALLFICLFVLLAPAGYAGSGEADSPGTENAEAGEPAVEDSGTGESEGWEEDSEEESSGEENSVEEDSGEDRETVEFFPADFPSVSPGSLENLEEILASPDFGGEKEGWGIRLKKTGTQRKIPRINLFPGLEKIKRFFSLALRFLVALVIVAAAGFAVYWIWRQRRKGIFASRDRGKSYANPFISSESPETLFARAEHCFGTGLLREAWALCLSGCMGAAARYCSLSFPKDTTEYGCLSLVRAAMPSRAGGFSAIVQSWILFAYGGRLPGEGEFERALVWGRSLALEETPPQSALNVSLDVPLETPEAGALDVSRNGMRDAAQDPPGKKSFSDGKESFSEP